jgi:hypothetical protein
VADEAVLNIVRKKILKKGKKEKKIKKSPKKRKKEKKGGQRLTASIVRIPCKGKRSSRFTSALAPM